MGALLATIAIFHSRHPFSLTIDMFEKARDFRGCSDL